ncbi:MAG: hypothetical protein AAB470_00475 [Patescibacteria group bacterium]
MNKIPQNKGLVRAVIVIVIALLILSYLGINIRSIVNSPAGQENFNYTQEVILNVWNNYLKGPATYLYNDIFIKLIWDPAIESLTRIKNGQPTNIDQSAPTIKIE